MNDNGDAIAFCEHSTRLQVVPFLFTSRLPGGVQTSLIIHDEPG